MENSNGDKVLSMIGNITTIIAMILFIVSSKVEPRYVETACYDGRGNVIPGILCRGLDDSWSSALYSAKGMFGFFAIILAILWGLETYQKANNRKKVKK